jgi:hypothetical protein
MTFGEAASVVPIFALEAQMTHKTNHREPPVQKAGQKAGAVLPLSPNPAGARCESSSFVPQGVTASVVRCEPTSLLVLASEETGAERAAGGEALSKKTSTAALDSFCRSPLPLQRRAPRQENPNVAPTFRGAPFHPGSGFQNPAGISRNEIAILFFRKTS